MGIIGKMRYQYSSISFPVEVPSISGADDLAKSLCFNFTVYLQVADPGHMVYSLCLRICGIFSGNLRRILKLVSLTRPSSLITKATSRYRPIQSSNLRFDIVFVGTI